MSRDKFAQSPLVVIWEVTRACDLACVHCRAMAIPNRESGEMTTDEGRALIRQVREFGRPLFVLTGGDPLKRNDIHDLIAAAKDVGLPTHLSPSGTPLLTHAALLRARDAGLDGISISLDGSNERIHDEFRGVEGSFQWSLEGAAAATGLGLRLQINTTLTRHNLNDLEAIADLVGALEADRWTVFLLIPTGRAVAGQQITAAEAEDAFRWLYRLSCGAPFRIKTTEAPHYRRIALQMREAEGTAPTTGSGGGRFVPGMNDGSGFVFISSRGDIHPSGFLPLPAGNVRVDSLLKTYREHPMFVALRDPDRLGGRCGRCEFRSVCGGSRARAYAMTGDYLSEDPACAYEPREEGRS
jgi:radical SAM protein